MSAEAWYDLHVHSVFSDGVLSLLQLGHLARLVGLTGFAVCDHDSLAAPEELAAVPARFKVEAISGVELSCLFGAGGVHLLGLFVDPTSVRLRQIVAALQEERWRRWRRLLQLLADRQISLPSTPPATRSPGRRHLAKMLVHRGHAGSIRAAFQQHLTPLMSQAPFERPSVRDAIDAIHDAGGRAILAHPAPGLQDPQFRQLADWGLDGIEVEFPSVQRKHQKELRRLATAFDWIGSAGSDYHGDQTGDQLGRCTVGAKVIEQFRCPSAPTPAG